MLPVAVHGAADAPVLQPIAAIASNTESAALKRKASRPIGHAKNEFKMFLGAEGWGKHAVLDSARQSTVVVPFGMENRARKADAGKMIIISARPVEGSRINNMKSSPEPNTGNASLNEPIGNAATVQGEQLDANTSPSSRH